MIKNIDEEKELSIIEKQIKAKEKKAFVNSFISKIEDYKSEEISEKDFFALCKKEPFSINDQTLILKIFLNKINRNIIIKFFNQKIENKVSKALSEEAINNEDFDRKNNMDYDYISYSNEVSYTNNEFEFGEIIEEVFQEIILIIKGTGVKSFESIKNGLKDIKSDDPISTEVEFIRKYRNTYFIENLKQGNNLREYINNYQQSSEKKKKIIIEVITYLYCTELKIISKKSSQPQNNEAHENNEAEKTTDIMDISEKTKFIINSLNLPVNCTYINVIKALQLQFKTLGISNKVIAFLSFFKSKNNQFKFSGQEINLKEFFNAYKKNEYDIQKYFNSYFSKYTNNNSNFEKLKEVLESLKNPSYVINKDDLNKAFKSNIAIILNETLLRDLNFISDSQKNSKFNCDLIKSSTNYAIFEMTKNIYIIIDPASPYINAPWYTNCIKPLAIAKKNTPTGYLNYEDVSGFNSSDHAYDLIKAKIHKANLKFLRDILSYCFIKNFYYTIDLKDDTDYLNESSIEKDLEFEIEKIEKNIFPIIKTIILEYAKKYPLIIGYFNQIIIGENIGKDKSQKEDFKKYLDPNHNIFKNKNKKAEREKYIELCKNHILGEYITNINFLKCFEDLIEFNREKLEKIREDFLILQKLKKSIESKAFFDKYKAIEIKIDISKFTSFSAQDKEKYFIDLESKYIDFLYNIATQILYIVHKAKLIDENILVNIDCCLINKRRMVYTKELDLRFILNEKKINSILDKFDCPKKFNEFINEYIESLIGITKEDLASIKV